MHITELHIVNFRCFNGRFDLELGEHANIIVGDNDAGKSTILDAIGLALSGLSNGRYISNELNEFMFNAEVVEAYVEELRNGNYPDLPEIIVEVVLSDDSPPALEGNGNLDKTKAQGVGLRIAFDHAYDAEYEALISCDELPSTLPIEYYSATWTTFAREVISTRSIPIRAAMIDASSSRYQSGADVYISRIVRDHLSDIERVKLAQAYRNMRDGFVQTGSIEAINEKISAAADVPDRRLKVSANLTTKSAWESVLSTFLDNIPFQYVGKGTQSTIKTKLALSEAPGSKPNIVLIEEPENHLSHGNLNALLSTISSDSDERQIIVSTHSSFVANKLGLSDLILLHGGETTRLSDLPQETWEFFRKMPGFETLRVLLCRRAVLVEGPSDELVFQRAYMDTHQGRLPIYDGIDVMSVALTFKRFLDVATALGKPVAVITDNDGDYVANVEVKFASYADDENVEVFADNRNEYRTLEPQVIDANYGNLDNLRSVLGLAHITYPDAASVADWMGNNKVEAALRIFDAPAAITYPSYIQDAVAWCDAE